MKKLVSEGISVEVIAKNFVRSADLVLRKTPSDIEEAARRAILAAGVGGGYILSTGDSVPRDAPFENVAAITKTARQFGALNRK